MPVSMPLPKDHKNFLEAAKIGDLEKIKKHLEYELQHGLTVAAFRGHYEVVDYLIKQGANVNADTDLGLTPLTAAIKGKHTAIVERLLKEPAIDTNKYDPSGQTPLHHAIGVKSEKIVKLLIEHNCDIEALIITATNGQINEYEGTPPLLYALFNDNENIAKLLIETGANIENQGRTDTTPLVYSVYANLSNTTSLLIKRGADIEATTPMGNNIFELAILRNLEIEEKGEGLSVLLKDIPKKDIPKLNTLFKLAMQQEDIYCARIILEFNADDALENEVLPDIHTPLIEDSTDNTVDTLTNRTKWIKMLQDCYEKFSQAEQTPSLVQKTVEKIDECTKQNPVFIEPLQKLLPFELFEKYQHAPTERNNREQYFQPKTKTYLERLANELDFDLRETSQGSNALESAEPSSLKKFRTSNN